jgi:RhoGAP domain
MVVFGRPLVEVAQGQNASRLCPGVPHVVVECIELVRCAGLSLEGIFRISGNAADVTALKARVDKEPNFSFHEAKVAPHDASTLLKQYLRELPSPVLTTELFDEWIEVASMNPGIESHAAMKGLVDRLPEAHRAMLRTLLPFCKLVYANSEFNKMPAANLAKVIGPNLLWKEEEETSDPMAYLMLSNKINDLCEQMFKGWEHIVPGADDPNPVSMVAKMYGHVKSCAAVIDSGNGEVWSRDTGGKVRVWNVAKRELVKEFDTGQGSGMFDMRRTGDGHIWSTSGGGTKVWDAATQQLVKEIPGFAYGIHAVGSEVWLGGEQKFDVYDRSTFQKLREFDGGLSRGCVVTCMTTNRSGSQIWGGSVDPIVRVWDRQTGELVAELTGHSRKVSAIVCVGDQVWSAEGTVNVWDANDRRKVAELSGHEGTIHCIQPFGNQLVWTSAWDGVIVAWDRETLTQTFRLETFASDAISRVIPVQNGDTSETEAWGASWDKSVLVCRLDSQHQNVPSLSEMVPLSGDRDENERRAAVDARRAELMAAQEHLATLQGRVDAQRRELDAKLRQLNS